MPPNSNLGRISEPGLLADERVISNAGRQMRWRDSETHTDICSYCGEPGCGSPANISLRNVADHLAIMPRVDVPEWIPGEPPNPPVRSHFPWCPALEHGIVLLSTEDCLHLNNLGMNVKRPGTYPTPNRREIQAMLAWDAPIELTTYRDERFDIDRTLLYACSRGDVDEGCDTVLQLFESITHRIETFETEAAINPLTLYIGEPYWSEWTPFIEVDGEWYVSLFPGIGAIAN